MRKINDERILAALLAAGTVRRAAQIADVSESTIRNRMADPVFKSKYDKQRGDVLQEATAALMARLQAAAETMTDIMEDEKNPAGVRLAACDGLLRHCLRYFSASEIERRLSELEEASRGIEL